MLKELWLLSAIGHPHQLPKGKNTEAQSNDETSYPSSLVQGKSQIADISDLHISSNNGEPVSQACPQVQERMQSTDDLPLTQLRQQFNTIWNIYWNTMRWTKSTLKMQQEGNMSIQKQNRMTAGICTEKMSTLIWTAKGQRYQNASLKNKNKRETSQKCELYTS